MTTVTRAEAPIPRELQEKIDAARAKQREVKLKFWNETCEIDEDTWNELKENRTPEFDLNK